MYQQRLTILGPPKALKRHRTYTRGRGGRPLPYPIQVDPSKTDKADLLSIVRDKAPDKPLAGPVLLMMTFYMARPRSHYGTGKNAGKLKELAPKHHTVRPDVDNLIKLIADSLNGVFWRDDTQICFCQARKEYSERPRTEILIKELGA